jgi:hypothetical protein
MIFYNGFNLLVDLFLVSVAVLVTYNVMAKKYHKPPF